MKCNKFEVIFYGDVVNCVRDEDGNEYNLQEMIAILNDQQATINELQSIKKQCNHKKAILDFLNFMKMDNPLMEIMVDEFLEEVKK